MLKIIPNIILFFSLNIFAQQAADTSFTPSNQKQTFKGADRPIVLIDEAHNNFHTMSGRYQAFAKVLQSDGFIVKSNQCKFNLDSLKSAAVLIIANALNERNTENWNLPNYSAFSREEIEAVYHWIKEGGSLLLIADHMPFPAASKDLAAIFGFQFCNGFALDSTNRSLTIFRRSDGTLCSHPVTNGILNTKQIDSVRTFTGQAFLIPYDAQPILMFTKPTVLLMPINAWEFDDKTPIISADHWYQGATLEFGKGRIAVFGEAAMFTAQYIEQNNVWFGLKSEGAEQNEQFLLNLMHWLLKLI
jgi:hypothetical protein